MDTDWIDTFCEELKEEIENTIISCPTCKGTGTDYKSRDCLYPCKSCRGMGYFLKEEYDKSW